ncbi:hypothetical protein JCM33374_g3451 [Metschnikowia sp. JCM 33374]|nr:hypothetical protein JCM33374_g3451 [Metschnikowia sp. JCM 33374]
MIIKGPRRESHTETSQSKLSQLCFYHELDPWQQDNHYIRSAYVKETSSYAKSLKSLTYLHNESVNIYSHLVPAVLTTIAMISYFTSSLQDHHNPAWVRMNFLQFGFGASVCLSSSASFHLFKSHSPKVCGFGNQCDYFGIVVMITCSLISIIVFAFDDLPQWKNTFIGMFITFGSICTKVTFDKKFATPQYRPFRSLMFILFGLSGLIPVITAFYIFGPSNAFDRSSAEWLILEGLFYILGAVLYAARLPERLYHKEKHNHERIPGKFDLFGHSHQIFHFMVVIAALCHFKALSDCYFQWQVRQY